MDFNFFNKRELTNEEKLNRFYKKIKVKSSNSKSEINEKIFAYAAKGKRLDLLYLDEERLVDPVFMSIIYNVNPKVLAYYKPDVLLQENFMFMKVYIRNMLSHANLTQQNMHDYLLKFLSPCAHALKNIDVVKYLIEAQTGTSAILAVKDILLNDSFNGCVDRENYEALISILDNLSIECFDREIRYDNGAVLKALDTTHKFYSELSKKAARTHGFIALKNIERYYIMQNPDIIYHAVDKDGVYMLYQYLMFELKRKPEDPCYVSEEKKKLRKALIKDDKIREMLNDEFMVQNEMLDALYSQI